MKKNKSKTSDNWNINYWQVNAPSIVTIRDQSICMSARWVQFRSLSSKHLWVNLRSGSLNECKAKYNWSFSTDSDTRRFPITYSADMHRMQSVQTFVIDGNVDHPANLFTTRFVVICILTFIRLNIKISSNVSVQRKHCTSFLSFLIF